MKKEKKKLGTRCPESCPFSSSYHIYFIVSLDEMLLQPLGLPNLAVVAATARLAHERRRGSGADEAETVSDGFVLDAVRASVRVKRKVFADVFAQREPPL